MQWTAGPWESMISSWGSWRVPGGWIPPGHPLCPLGTSLLSWLDFRGAPLSHWTESSWNTCLLRQRSWPRSLPSNGSGTNISAAMSSKKLTFILTGCSEYLYISVCIWYEDSFTQMKGWNYHEVTLRAVLEMLFVCLCPRWDVTRASVCVLKEKRTSLSHSFIQRYDRVIWVNGHQIE